MPVPPKTPGRRSTRSHNPQLMSLPSDNTQGLRTPPNSQPTRAYLNTIPGRSNASGRHHAGYDSVDDLTDHSSSSIEADSSGSDYDSDYSSDAAAEQILNEHRRARMRPNSVITQTPHYEDRVTAGEAIATAPGPSDVFSNAQYSFVLTYAIMDLMVVAPDAMKQNEFSTRPLLSSMMFLHWVINGTGPCGFLYLLVVCSVLAATSIVLTAMAILGAKGSCPRTLSRINSQLRQRFSQIVRQFVFAFGWRHGGGLAFWYCALMLIVSGYAMVRNMQFLKRSETKKRSASIYSPIVMLGLIFTVVGVDVSQTHPWSVAKWYAGRSVGSSGSDYAKHSGMRLDVCNPHDLEPATVTWHTKFSQRHAVVTYAAIGCNYLASEVPTYETTVVTTTTREKPVIPKGTSIAPFITFPQKTDVSEDTSAPVTSLSRKSSKSKITPISTKSKDTLISAKSSSKKSSSSKRSSMSKTAPVSVKRPQSVAASTKIDSAATAELSVEQKPSLWNTVTEFLTSAEESQVTTQMEEDIISSIPISSLQVESDNVPLSLTETDSSLAVDEPSHASFEFEAPQTEMTKGKMSTFKRSKSPIIEKAPKSSASKADTSKDSSASGSTTWTITNAEKAEKDRTTLWVFDDTWTTRVASQLGILR